MSEEFITTYICPTCNKRASGRGHMCHPFEGAVPFVCEFCNKSVNDARHICVQMLDKLEYTCRSCGRVAVYDSNLCQPQPIDGD